MTDLDAVLDHNDDTLRRALHAEADAVVPAVDGLERIRARTSARRDSRPALALLAFQMLLVAALLQGGS